jgi:hypothetical protein
MKEPITADLIKKALQPLTDISEQRKADFIEFLKTTIYYDEEKQKEIDKKGIYKDVFLNIDLNRHLAEILIGFGIKVVHNDNFSKNVAIFTYRHGALNFLDDDFELKLNESFFDEITLKDFEKSRKTFTFEIPKLDTQ